MNVYKYFRTYAHGGDSSSSLVFFAGFAGRKHQRKDIFRSAEDEKALFAYALYIFALFASFAGKQSKNDEVLGAQP